MKSGRVAMSPASGIEIVDGRMVAVSLPAWLEISAPGLVGGGKWIRIRYSSSFLDYPSRPSIRFEREDGDAVEFNMNAPILGSAEWVGHMPADTVAVKISPVARLGPINFRVDAIERLTTLRMLADGLRMGPSWTYEAIRNHLRGMPELALHQMKFAVGSVPIERYAPWHAKRSRAIEPDDLDRPRPGDEIDLILVMHLRGEEPDLVRRTVASLQAQTRQAWQLVGIVDSGTSGPTAAAYHAMARVDGRLVASHSDMEAGRTWIAAVSAGDILADYALAAMAASIEANRTCLVFYSDEDRTGPFGKPSSPKFKPDWSPLFHRSAPYIGRLTFVSQRALEMAGIADAGRVATDEANTLAQVLSDCGGTGVFHLPRILYRRNGVPADASKPVSPNDPVEWPSAAIIMPTRDAPDLLARSLDSLRQTAYPRLKLVVVDNGTVDRRALALMQSLQSDDRFEVVARPGPFNHSFLSNEGARAAESDVLVFLNNDVTTNDRDWLKKMVRHAIRPETGMVGAKLLLEDGRIQHAGVVLGLGGSTGHIYYGSRADEPGYLSQLVAPREVAAVTAACCAIERQKFDAVGGFDEVAFPTELNDIDLCLRLMERGFTNIWTPETTLTHMQSASRGKASSKPFAAHEREQRLFSQRWGASLRHDPYFHPALSLYARTPRLA